MSVLDQYANNKTIVLKNTVLAGLKWKWASSSSFFSSHLDPVCKHTPAHTPKHKHTHKHTFSLNEVKTVAWGEKVTHTNPFSVRPSVLCAGARFDWQATPCRGEGRWFAWARNSPSHLRAWLLAWVIRDFQCFCSLKWIYCLHWSKNKWFPWSCIIINVRPEVIIEEHKSYPILL